MADPIDDLVEEMLRNVGITQYMTLIMEEARCLPNKKTGGSREMALESLKQSRQNLTQLILDEAKCDVPVENLLQVQSVNISFEELDKLGRRATNLEKKDQQAKLNAGDGPAPESVYQRECEKIFTEVIGVILCNAKKMGGIRKPTGSRVSPPVGYVGEERVSFGPDEVRMLPEVPSSRDERAGSRGEAKATKSQRKRKSSTEARPDKGKARAAETEARPGKGKARAASPAPANETEPEETETEPEDEGSYGPGPAFKHKPAVPAALVPAPLAPADPAPAPLIPADPVPAPLVPAVQAKAGKTNMETQTTITFGPKLRVSWTITDDEGGPAAPVLQIAAPVVQAEPVAPVVQAPVVQPVQPAAPVVQAPVVQPRPASPVVQAPVVQPRPASPVVQPAQPVAPAVQPRRAARAVQPAQPAAAGGDSFVDLTNE